jgi:type II secretory pathway pseudopilin PulG
MQGLIIAVVILAVLGGALWFTQRRQKINETALAQLAQSQGWQYQKSYELSHLGSGNVLRYRFSQAHEDGGGWTLDIETASAGAGGAPLQSTIWRSADVKLPDGLVLIGPRPKDMPANLDFGGMLTQAALQMLLRATLGNDAPDTSHLREVKKGSPDLLGHYLVFATDEALPGRLLTSEVERALLALTRSLKEKQRPAVVFREQGLQVKCVGLISDPPNLQRIAALGDALKAAWPDN